MMKTENMSFYLAAGSAVLAAQLGSYLVDSRLSLGQSIELFSFLHLTHVRNFGGIFGFGQGMGWVFAAVSGLVLLAVVYYVHRVKEIRPIERLCFGLIVGGGASNIIDRMVYGSVIDYVDIRGVPMWTYIFNTADVLIHCGIWPIIILSLVPIKRKTKAS